METTRRAFELKRNEFDVVFILPRRSKFPVGGFKMTYEYANGLALKGFRVLVAHGIVFKSGGKQLITSSSNPNKIRPKHLLAILSWMAIPRGRKIRVGWFENHPSVEYREFPVLTSRNLPLSSQYVATSWRTAMFLAKSSVELSKGHYLIQGFEAWDKSELTTAHVTETWKSGLSNIVISEWLLRMADTLGVHAALVRNFVNRNDFPEGPQIQNRSIDVLFHASTHEIKRLDKAIEVAGALLKDFPALTFKAFGTEDLSKRLPDWCEFTRNPSRAVLSQLYMQSKFYLVTSDSEGWCLPALEAMSSGAVVVSTRNGGVDSFAPNVAVFPKDNSAVELTNTVRELMQNSDSATLQLRAKAGIDLAISLDRENSIQDLIAVLKISPNPDKIPNQ